MRTDLMKSEEKLYIEECCLVLLMGFSGCQKMQSGDRNGKNAKEENCYNLTVSSKVETQHAFARYVQMQLRVSAKEYDLYMRFDTNTNGHMQWYYFSVKNARKMKVKFNMFRFRKRYSLYQRGFRPYTRSRKQGNDWMPAGENVKYYREMVTNENGVKKFSGWYYLSFSYTFQHDQDEVFFAACIPYTTTHLNKRLDQWQEAFMSDKVQFKKLPLCISPCGQEIQYISIQPKEDQQMPKTKQYIIINTRSHPGQTSSSWVTDGLLQSLISNVQVHKWMVEMNICFKIVPMLNKDGVFMGNYRTGIVGDDFNRRFNSGQRQYFPEIAALKRLVAKCKQKGQVKLFLDVHGHSVLKNSFFFGPDQRCYQDQPLYQLGQFLAQQSKYFSRQSSTYQNDRKKIQTARVYFQMQQNLFTLTCQNSLGLFSQNYQTFQQTSKDWQIFGNHILMAIRSTFIDGNTLAPNESRRAIGKLKSTLQYFTTNRKNQVVVNTLTKTNNNKKQSTALLKTPTIQKKNSLNTEEQRKPEIIEVPEPSRKMSRHKEKKEASQQIQQDLSLNRYNELKSVQIQVDSSNEPISPTKFQKSSAQPSQSVIQQQLYGEEESVPDNFSDEYISINDSDSEAEDIDAAKKMQMFRCIQQYCNNGYDPGYEGLLSRQQLVPLKGFKQYKMNLDQGPSAYILPEKKIPTRLKPLKFNQYKSRGVTQKKIKGPAQLLFENQSTLNCSDRQKSRSSWLKNEVISRRMKEMKKDDLMKEMFPHIEEEECLLLRIKEMRVQGQKEL